MLYHPVSYENGQLLIYSIACYHALDRIWSSTQWLEVYTGSGLKCLTSSCRSKVCVARARVLKGLGSYKLSSGKECMCSFYVCVYLSVLHRGSPFIVQGGPPYRMAIVPLKKWKLASSVGRGILLLQSGSSSPSVGVGRLLLTNSLDDGILSCSSCSTSRGWNSHWGAWHVDLQSVSPCHCAICRGADRMVMMTPCEMMWVDGSFRRPSSRTVRWNSAHYLGVSVHCGPREWSGRLYSQCWLLHLSSLAVSSLMRIC